MCHNFFVTECMLVSWLLYFISIFFTHNFIICRTATRSSLTMSSLMAPRYEGIKQKCTYKKKVSRSSLLIWQTLLNNMRFMEKFRDTALTQSLDIPKLSAHPVTNYYFRVLNRIRLYACKSFMSFQAPVVGIISNRAWDKSPQTSLTIKFSWKFRC